MVMWCKLEALSRRPHPLQLPPRPRRRQPRLRTGESRVRHPQQPLVLLAQRLDRRLDRVERVVDDAVDLLARLLRVVHPLYQPALEFAQQAITTRAAPVRPVSPQ